MTTVEVLRAARKRIEDPDLWCSYGWGLGDRACMLHALEDASWPGHPSTAAPLADLPGYHALVGAIGCGYNDVGRFNDTHTHAEVLAAFDRAIANEEAREAEFAADGFNIVTDTPMEVTV